MEQSEWKSRLSAYENILYMMENPTEELNEELSIQLPVFLSDSNLKCQRTALLICIKYFKSSQTVEYFKYANLIIKKDFLINPNTADISKNLLIICLDKERGKVLNLLFEDILNKPKEYIRVVISIVVSHLATLTSKDSDYVKDITDKLQILEEIDDEEIKNDTDSGISTAKIITGNKDITNDFSLMTFNSTEKSWPELIRSTDWKDRKTGYEELLSLINENYQLNTIERNFLIPAGVEKNSQCEIVVVQIIEKLAITFKNQLMRKLNEYVTPVINLLSQKHISKQQTQNAFDALALNVVASPYEPPFLEHLLKMMKSSSVKLKKESISFVSRCNITPLSSQILECLQTLSTDTNLSVRELASNLLNKMKETYPKEITNKDTKENEEKVKLPSKLRSPELRRGNRRHTTLMNSKTVWDNWIDPNTLHLLKSGQWTSVTKGIEDLYLQFTQNPIQPSAIIVSLSSLFKGKTFTPKVMNKLMQHILNYIKYDTNKVTNEAVINATQFALDNITDKRFQQIIFEILDTLTEINSQLVFQQLYQQVSAKNPAYPLHITTYFYHYLLKYGKETSLNMEEFSAQIKTLSGHSDSAIRKLANDCNEVVSNLNPDISFDNSKIQKFRKQSPSSISVNAEKSQNIDRQSKSDAKSKGKPETPNQRISKISFQKQQNVSNNEKSLIQSRLISSLSKTSSIFEVRKSLDEIETILTKYLEANGQSSVSSNEFTELFQKLRQWLKDSNTSIVLSVTKIISLSFKLIKSDQISNVSKDFLIDTCLLLNFTQKGITSAALGALSQLYSIYPLFVPEIFLPAFNKLSFEGKKAGTSFLKNLSFEMNVQQYTSLILNYLIDKLDTYRESAKPLVEQFMNLSGSKEALQKASEKFPPAQKSLLLSRLSYFDKGDMSNTFLKVVPQDIEKKNRMQKIDSSLPFKILNSEASIDSLNEIIEKFANFYFLAPKEITSTESKIINDCYQKFITLAKTSFNSFYNIFDIVLFWCAKQLLFIQVQDDFQGMIKFLMTILTELQNKKQMLSKYEAMIILPTILECNGRNKDEWSQIYLLISKLTNKNEIMDILISLISNASSVFSIIGILNALMEMIPSIDIKKYIDTLQKITENIQNFASQDKESHKELFDISTKFNSFLEKYITPKNEKGKVLQNKSPVSVHSQKQNISSLPKPKIKQNNKTNHSEKIVSSCNLQQSFKHKLESPMLQLYKWIADLNSNDSHLIFSSIKSISNQLKTDPSVFTIHLDPLITSLISVFHSQFSSSPIPIRLCKYLSFCLLAFLNESSFNLNLQSDSVNQIVLETITHLSNGISEPILNQVLNAVMVKIMEDYQYLTFKALILAISEYKNSDKLSDIWFKFAIKCFETCNIRICEKGKIDEIIQTIVDLDSFYQNNPMKELAQIHIGQKINKAITKYLTLVIQKYPDILDKHNLKSSLSNNSPITEIMNTNVK